MQIMPVFVHHKGRWNEVMDYVDFEVTGITMQTNCSFDEIVKILSDQLQINVELLFFIVIFLFLTKINKYKQRQTTKSIENYI